MPNSRPTATDALNHGPPKRKRPALLDSSFPTEVQVKIKGTFRDTQRIVSVKYLFVSFVCHLITSIFSENGHPLNFRDMKKFKVSYFPIATNKCQLWIFGKELDLTWFGGNGTKKQQLIWEDWSSFQNDRTVKPKINETVRKESKHSW